MRHSMSADWPNIADLLVGNGAEVALIGAPLHLGSVTPGRCDLAPMRVRETLHRLGSFDVDVGGDVRVSVSDIGDLDIVDMRPADAFAVIRETIDRTTAVVPLTILLGGNNAITRPGAHGLARGRGLALDRIGLITLDAHHDMRHTRDGPSNGNPVRCLLEDGLPGRNICQIGIAPFANTAVMYRDALANGIGVFTASDVRRYGIDRVLTDALDRLGHVDRIVVDFDIDVMDRAYCPGAPGARPGGLSNLAFFAAARRLAAEPRVALVDLTEFDPSLDVADITAFTAGRWLVEILAGYQQRSAS